MSRVVAFGCCHICTPETQVELFDRPLDYSYVRILMEQLAASPPDILVNLGDFWEPLYDAPGLVDDLIPEYAQIPCKRIEIGGNHDRNGTDSIEIDGVLYEHGHLRVKGVAAVSKEEYLAAVRRAYDGQRLVHAHTHIPHEPWPLDVGSVTLSGTYGEILDGNARLVKIDG